MLVSRQDYAKYPFTREVSEYVKSLDLRMEELDSPIYVEVVDRAEERLKQALTDGFVSPSSDVPTEAEILSYPVAMALVASIGDSFLKRRYALSEAKRIDFLLSEENDAKLLEISRISLGWRVERRPCRRGRTHVLTLHFADYLKNAAGFHDDYWKLVNRRMSDGGVVVEKGDLARLMSEEVRAKIEKDLERIPKVSFQEIAPKLAARVEDIRKALVERKESLRTEELPADIVAAAYPPCVRRLHDLLLSGQHIPHMGRLTLTSFLLSIGMKTDDLVRLYTSISDFSEALTRYQVEHIAGQRGSGTKYNPPKCGTLRTHNLCPGPDDLCEHIWHPLSYYQRKARRLKSAAGE